MFAVIHLPQFALQAVLRHDPALWTRPVALIDPALAVPRACELTAVAAGAGVTVGLTAPQALARCRDVIIRYRSAIQETAAIDAVLQCAYSFSPHIENTAPGICTLDLRGLAELKGANVMALASWAGRLREKLASLNLHARIGAGPTPGVAGHAARWPAENGPDGPEPAGGPRSEGVERTSHSAHYENCVSIIKEPQTFIAALPVAALEPSREVTLILRKWGIRTVGALLALGQAAVAERIGLEALALFAAASTTAMRPLNRVAAAEQFEEAFEFDHTVETIEPLLFILRRFVDQLSQRLELSSFAAELLTLRLRLESGEILERRLRIPQPTRQREILFRMLHTHLETLRTPSPIVSVTLKADPAQPEQKQFSLFEAALRDPPQFQETLARLSALLGADRVGTPVRANSHRADAFKLVPPDFENASSDTATRVSEFLSVTPLRRFRPALKVKLECDFAAPRHLHNSFLTQAPFPPERESAAQALEQFRTRGQVKQSPAAASLRSIAKGELKIAIGPWRASGNWWEPAAWQREEWDVATTDGTALRLVRIDNEWCVEAILD